MFNNFICSHKQYSLVSPISNNEVKWKEVSHFKSKGILVEKFLVQNQNRPECDCFEISQKFKRPFSCPEHTLRLILGICLVILTLGLALIFKYVRQLFYKKYAIIKLMSPVSFENMSSKYDLSHIFSQHPAIDFKNIKKNKLSFYCNLYNFYHQNNIFLGREPIQLSEIDFQSLGLDLTESFNGFTMKEAVIAVINYINVIIESQFNRYPNQTIKEIRKLNLLNSRLKNDNLINEEICPLKLELSLNNLHCGINSPSKIKGKHISKAHNSWLAQIVKALIKQRLIFCIENLNTNTFIIQA